MKEQIKKIDGNITRLMIILIVFLVIACLTKSTKFANLGNFQSMGKSLSEYGLMAMGVGICMISGGIDLSTVYIANLCGIAAGLLMKNAGIGIGPAVAAALCIGLLCGGFNGILISYLKIPAMLATLGSYQLFMGIAIVISKGSTVSGIPAAYTRFGTMTIAGIPMSFIVFLLVAVVMTIIVSKTKFGKRVFLVGTNIKAARFSGVRNNVILIKVYMLSGLISAIAGLISLARINSAKADFGTSYTMQCILIAVLGGVNPDGGFGSIPGIAIAVLILQFLSSYLNMFPNISNYYRDLIWGAALIAILIMNVTIKKRKQDKLRKMS